MVSPSGREKGGSRLLNDLWRHAGPVVRHLDKKSVAAKDALTLDRCFDENLRIAGDFDGKRLADRLWIWA
jgi:hypothetical protein